jgi:hypothetical protein
MAETLFESTSPRLGQLLDDIERGKLALPELQRPFVWDRVDVRNLLDSMYRGFPVGYLMLWNTSDIDHRLIGTGPRQYEPTEFIIDGQQRLTGLYAVMKGSPVTFKDFSQGQIRMAFRPRDATFAVPDATVGNDPEYVADITELWVSNAGWEVVNGFVERLRAARPDALADEQEGTLRDSLGRLTALRDYPFDAVRIKSEVSEELVAEIFLRVNSGGTQLTQADFILTMLSVNREQDRRRLEEFARLARIVPGEGTDASPYNYLIKPAADQLLRVAVLVAFGRGRLRSVLSLLKGGSVEGEDTNVGEEQRAEQFDRLSAAIDEVLDLTAWHEYLKALAAAGVQRSTEISSENNAILVYALYLIGRRYGLSHSALRTTIARYFFMSALTGRYTGSFETQITQDAQSFTQADTGEEYLTRLRDAIDTTLTDDYWAITLPSALATSAARGPTLYSYAASLCLLNARVPPFVAADANGEHKAAIPIRNLFDPSIRAKKAGVERHHLFPRAYLEREGIIGTRRVNQVANMCYVEWPENIEISDTAPAGYWPRFAEQFSATDLFHHALPDDWEQMGYETFLEARRRAIAQVISAGFKTIGAAPDDELRAPTPPRVADAYLHPDRPFSNELAIRRIIRQLRGVVFWYEQHMPGRALELLLEELQLDEVDEVRLLSGPANINSKVKRSFDRFAIELEGRNVGCDWRILAAERARALHARVIADDDETYEVPPLNSVLAGTVDSIRASEMPLGSFADAYSVGESLSEYQPTS